MSSPPPKSLDLHQIFTWLVADRTVAQADARGFYNQAQGLQKASSMAMHPLVAVAQAKLLSAKPPHRMLTLDWLTEWVAARAGLPFYRIDPLKIDFTRVADVMSATYASRFGILPVEMTGTELTIATADPLRLDWVAEIAKISRREIRLVMASPLDIAQYTAQFFALAKSIKGASRQGGQDLALRNNLEQLVELGKGNRQLDANDQHIINIVDWLWQYAFEQRASDIHLEPKREAGLVRFRIDGLLHQVYQVPPQVLLAMTSRIKLLGRMDVVEKRRPQDGRVKTRAANGQEIELRLSTLPTAFGEKLVMRIFDPEVVVKTLPELGFPAADAARWDALTARPNGILLVTGPTGSGKTSTLYTTLKALATSEVNVCTVEDPIEMVEPAFNQMQVQNGIDLSFADGVRALMRQDPDIIMVGEIRDLETADIAIKAAQTGHMVFSTLHTNDAPSTLTRLMNMGVAPFNIASSVILITAQRLARRLCTCKQPLAMTDDALLAAGYRPAELGDWKPMGPVGCERCLGSGYKGRVGIYQIMPITAAIEKIILAHGNSMDIAAQSEADGVNSLRRSGLMKVKQGLTSLEEVLGCTNE